MEVKQKHVEERWFGIQMLAQITVVSFLQKKAHLTCNLDYFISLFPLKRKSTFIFMTANMISCLKIEKWTCSLRFWEHKVNLSAMRLSWLCDLLWIINLCVMTDMNHYCKFPQQGFVFMPVRFLFYWYFETKIYMTIKFVKQAYC